MNKHRENALRSAGIDTDKYFSMRINKESIPDGAEVVVQIRDKVTGEIRNIPVNSAFGENDGYFGKNSRFYKQVMADGHVFNPYIHRRFLPSQFRRNIRIAGYDGIQDFVTRHYGWNYVVRFLRDECAKLAMLELRDKEAFRERSRFFTLEDMREIFCEYATAVCQALDSAVEENKNVRPCRGMAAYYYIKGMAAIKKEHVRPMRYRYVKFCESVRACRSYAQLSKQLADFHFDKLDNAIPSSDRFAQCFINSGAYYTIKQMIMFEGLRPYEGDVKDNLDALSSNPVGAYIWSYRRQNL